MRKLNLIKAIFLDLEGTLYFKEKQIEGASATLADLKQRQIQVRLLTNTDSKSPSNIHKQLAAMGIETDEDSIFTCVSAALEFLKENGKDNCYCLVSREIMPCFSDYHNDDGKVEWVVVGDFRDSVNCETMDRAFKHLVDGAELIALHKGRFFIRSDGYHLDTGAFVQLFEYASGKNAMVIGKPSPYFLKMALKQVGCKPNEVMIVGDDITTDIAGAKQIGALSVLVKTGKYNHQLLAQNEAQPDFIIESVGELLTLLGE